LLTLVAASFVAIHLLRVQMERDMGNRVSHPMFSETMFIKKLFDSLPEETWEEEIRNLRLHYPVPMELVDATDTALATEIKANLSEGKPMFHLFKEKRKVYIPLGEGKQVLILGPYKPFLPFRLGHLALVLGVILPIVGLVGLVLTYPVVRRLKKLEHAALLIGEGNLTARADINASDATGHLALSFNQMARKIQVLIEGQRHLLEAVSHEFRTPITRIGFILEKLSTSSDDQNRARRIQEIEVELQDLSRLVSELLLYMRFDATTSPLEKEPISVGEALQDPMTRQRTIHPEKSLEIKDSTSGKIEVFVHQAYFKRAMENLLSNALHYATRKVTVRCDRDESGLIVEVIDDGPGIPPAARETIFEPFTRIDNSRSRESGGVGLGLAIVKRIVESHDGSIRITDNEGSGSRFITRWPDPS